MFQLFEESSNNLPKILPCVPTHCVVSPVIPSPTLVSAARNEQRPFLPCFLAAPMPNSNCSPGTDKSQLPLETQKEIPCVHVHFICRTGSYETDSYYKCNTAHTWGRTQRDPGFSTKTISVAISQSCPLCFFLAFTRESLKSQKNFLCLSSALPTEPWIST